VTSVSNVASEIANDGFCITEPVVETSLLDQVIDELSSDVPRAGVRNLLDVSPAARVLARHAAVRAIPERMLGPHCFVTRAILFDKSPDANWRVPWHQDLAIAVQTRVEVPGFGPWSVKEGVPHVQPPADVLARMVTIRVHLDECGADNGPVRVIPRSHLRGKLTQIQIDAAKRSATEIACTVARGGILAFVPLLLHTSSPSLRPAHRRVAHFEFATDPLPGGLAWNLCWA